MALLGRWGWMPLYVGHIQKSWPVVMLSRCPDLKIPENIPINFKQTDSDYANLLKQDPNAPITGADLKK
tara:strand:- start:112 stop:318 length:207 start_codon:yes stop_codon:yes gene_type:complete